MPKGQPLTPYQQAIVRRHYQYQDAAAAQRLSELVSEIYLATTAKQADKLWKSVETYLAKTPAQPDRIARIVQSRDAKDLARLVSDLAPGGRLSK